MKDSHISSSEVYGVLNSLNKVRVAIVDTHKAIHRMKEGTLPIERRWVCAVLNAALAEAERELGERIILLEDA